MKKAAALSAAFFFMSSLCLLKDSILTSLLNKDPILTVSGCRGGGELCTTVVSHGVRMYIDPGSGALIWQAILSSAFGVIFHFRKSVRNIAARFFRGQKKRSEDF